MKLITSDGVHFTIPNDKIQFFVGIFKFLEPVYESLEEIDIVAESKYFQVIYDYYTNVKEYEVPLSEETSKLESDKLEHNIKEEQYQFIKKYDLCKYIFGSDEYKEIKEDVEKLANTAMCLLAEDFVNLCAYILATDLYIAPTLEGYKKAIEHYGKEKINSIDTCNKIEVEEQNTKELLIDDKEKMYM
jgi:hypothetical protein